MNAMGTKIAFQAILFQAAYSQRGPDGRVRDVDAAKQGQPGVHAWDKVVDVVECDDQATIAEIVGGWIGAPFLKVELSKLRFGRGEECEVLDTGVLWGVTS